MTILLRYLHSRERKLVPDGVCPKCGWKAPEGLLKCPFCKTYIREPGSSSSHDLKLRSKAKGSAETGRLPLLDPDKPPPDPKVVEKVRREIARELFADSDYKWPAPPPEPEKPAPEKPAT